MTADWVYGSILVLSLVHTIALAYAYMERRGDDGRELAGERATEASLECPECGTVNGSEFRYCRECVTELPSSTSLVRARSGPDSRQSL